MPYIMKVPVAAERRGRETGSACNTMQCTRTATRVSRLSPAAQSEAPEDNGRSDTDHAFFVAPSSFSYLMRVI